MGDSLEAAEESGQAQPVSRWKARIYWIISRVTPEIVFEILEIGYSLYGFRQARRKFRSSEIDAIFERYAIFGMIGARLAARWNKPLVLEINYTSASPLVRRRSRLLKPLARVCDRYLFARATAFAAVSSYLREHLVSRYGIARDQICVLPNAADTVHFNPAMEPGTSTADALGERLIGFVGGFYPWHGLELLLEAFAIVSQNLPDARLVLIGDGPTRPRVVTLAEHYGLTDKIALPGRVSYGQLPAWISKFRFGVLPDSNEYGSPMKIFEYMAMAKPVVVPDYPPIRDAVVDGVEGKIFRARDIGDLAACMQLLLTDDDLCRSMGAAARRKIEHVHNWQSNARRIAELLLAKPINT